MKSLICWIKGHKLIRAQTNGYFVCKRCLKYLKAKTTFQECSITEIYKSIQNNAPKLKAVK